VNRQLRCNTLQPWSGQLRAVTGRGKSGCRLDSVVTRW